MTGTVALPLTEEEKAELKARMLVWLAELESLDALTDESRKPVELDQQSVGRLSRMDALQQQAMALASRAPAP
ncbi:hypothetical protein [Brevundimonas diminuta]|uniref:hypothetical protein n=1 Tax=Brevundimonas diminuta TaxID=293 RepID=UPI003D9A358E